MLQLDILTPSQMNDLTHHLMDDVAQKANKPLPELEAALTLFNQRWQETFNHFAQNMAGELAYRDVLLYFQEKISPQIRAWCSGHEAVNQIETMLMSPLPPKRINRQLLLQMRQKQQLAQNPHEPLTCPHFDRPIFIVSAPRAGSTLLFQTMTNFAEIWSMGDENHEIEQDVPEMHPATYQYHSNRLTAEVATPALCQTVQTWFTKRLQNSDGLLYRQMTERPTRVRFLEKTPKNALRIPFLKAAFPEALFIYLYREPKANVSSMLEGWRSPRFVAYRDMPGWPYREWRFLLPPHWESLRERPLVEIAYFQWQAANDYIKQDLQELPSATWCTIDYEDLIKKPANTLKHIAKFANLQWTDKLEEIVSRPLPISHMALSTPVVDKWRKHTAELQTILPIFTERS